MGILEAAMAKFKGNYVIDDRENPTEVVLDITDYRKLLEELEPRRAGKRSASRLSRRPGNRLQWRMRIGEFRVIYEIDDKKRIILVLHIGHRRDIYR
jgi:mRNA-degrading endonuclease RelE of RelBE toxin-antitoxin system